MARFVLGFTALFFVLGAARSATARERAFAVSWSAPPECPDTSTIEQYVDDVLGDAGNGPLAVRATGVVARAADASYGVSLELDAGATQPSKRALSAPDCESVSRAAALLIGLAVRERAASAPVADSAQTKGAEQPGTPAKLPEAASAQAGAAHSERARGFVSLNALADAGSSPKATLGLGLAVGLSWTHLRLEPMLGYFAPRTATVSTRPELGAQFQLATAGARACSPFSSGNVWLAPCVGGGVDWLRARGFGARVTRNASTLDAIARAGLLVGWDISRIISARIELEGVLPLARPEFVIDGVGAVYRPDSLAARAGLGLDVHF